MIMNKTILTKQMLEEQYGTALKGLVECKDDNLILAQVCLNAYEDLVSIEGSYTIDELVAMDVPYSGIYKEFFHYYAGTTYGKSKEVCKHVAKYSKNKAFVEKLLKHAEHHLNKMEAAA